MKDNWLFLNQMSFNTDLIDSNTTVIVGFSGYGSVGTTVLNHIIERLDVESIGFWGTLSWFHKGVLETPITIYRLDVKSKDDKENFVLVTSRLPIPVVGYNALPDAFWKWLSQEILSWKAKRYIVIGGLREDVRNSSDDLWTTLLPTKRYTEIYGTQRTFKDDLTIKGPISFLLTEGTAYNLPVLGVLSYCNTYDVDLDAASMALKDLEKQLELDLNSKEIEEFDFSFLENQVELFQDETDFEEEFDSEYEEEFDEEFKSFDAEEDREKKFSVDENSSFHLDRTHKDDLNKYR
ncbi:MAG: hypothetical protein GOP50_03680 [Candidatus Heimdallarchaeota archaeon]|nr:hypothetical protein [Candidatus Heimdallarchaeota archaeon]